MAPTRSRLLTGADIDSTGATDSSTAVQAKIDALPAEGGDLYLPPGSAVKCAGLVVNKPITLRGGGHHGMTVDHIPSRLITDSRTASMFDIEAGGVTMQDVALINTATLDPTAGAAIAVGSGYFANLDRVSLIGFYDNMTVDNAWLYNMQGCHFHDAVHDYVKIGNAVNTDVGGSVIFGNHFTPLFHARVARSFLRWESAGGMRFIGNKMNGNNNLNPAAIVRTPPTNALDIVVGDGVNTGILQIEGNSIEGPGGSMNACIRAVLAAGNSGLLWGILIQGNQLTGGAYCVVVNPAAASRISMVTVKDNHLYAASTGGILVDKVSRVDIGHNHHDYSASSSVIPVTIGSGVTNLSMEPQTVNGDNIPILSDSSAGVANTSQGQMIPRWQRTIANVTSSSSYTTLYRFTPVDGTGGILRVTMSGVVAGVGPFVYRAEYGWSRSGATVTLTQIGSTTTQGAAIDVQLDTSVSGEVQVKVRRNSAGGGTAVNGRCDVEPFGPLAAVRKGA